MLMHRNTSLLCVISLIWSLPAVARGEAAITGVVVYPGSATIERTAAVVAGATQLSLYGLPSNFDIQTIRAQADPGIFIAQIVTRDVGSSDTVDPRQARLEAAIQSLKDRADALDAEAGSATMVKGFLERIAGNANAGDDKRRPVIDHKSFAGIIETIRREAGSAFERIQRVNIQKREIAKKVEALERDLERVSSGAKDGRTITVNLSAKQAGNVRLYYQLDGAAWKPAYRAMLDSTASTVELERMATVSQNTGEDWSHVKLRLSTGQPRLSPNAPEPHSWLLSFAKVVEVALQSRFAAAPAAIVLEQKAGKEPVPGGLPEPVVELQNTFVTEFEVPAQVDLPSDGREVSVALTKQTVPVKQKVRVVPRLDRGAVVTAEAKRPKGVWPAGNLQLFRDGNYVGATEWDAQSSEQFVFPFGRDDLVRVAVDRTNQQSNTTGVFGKSAERKVTDVYTLTSFHKAPIEMLLLEATPVGTSDEIKVTAAFDPKPTLETWEDRQGVVGWEKTLAPNKTVKFSVDYTIAYPKNGSVAGLP